MGTEITTEHGRLIVTEEVIATLAGVAATECYGIVGMASTKLRDGIAEMLGRENLSRGVEVLLDGEAVQISLYIVVGYGTRISEVAKNVTEQVRFVIQRDTGLVVTGVRIHVQGVKVGPHR